MSNWYVHLDQLKAALGIPANSSAADVLLGAAIEGVSRLIDEHLDFPGFPRVGVRRYTAKDGDCLYLDTPLLAVTTIRTDNDNNGSYETTWTTSDYYLEPTNATMESPPRPF